MNQQKFIFGINLNKAYKLVGFDPLSVQPTIQAQKMSEEKESTRWMAMA